jgi:hypothetical protein
MKGSDNAFPSILIEDHVDPAAPADGYHRLFIDTDEKLKMIDHASLVTDFTPGAGGSVATDAIWDAAGDLAVGSGADTAAKLTKGSDGTVLTMTAGAVGWAAVPLHGFSGARVYHSTTQSVGAAVTALNMDSEDFDTDTYHDNTTNNTRLTVPATGYYLVVGHVMFTYNGVNLMALRIDGTSDVRGSAWSAEATAGKGITTQVVYMTTGQYIELWAYQGGTANTGDTGGVNQNSLSIVRLA